MRAEGADVRAVTVWAAFGMAGWETLVTGEGGRYEPGLFDARSHRPRPAALARQARALAGGEEFDHPTLEAAGCERALSSGRGTSTTS